MKKVIANVKKNTTKLFFSNTLSSGLNLLSIFLLSNLLGLEQFGYIILVFTFIEILDSIINLKSWKAFIKFGVEQTQVGLGILVCISTSQMEWICVAPPEDDVKPQ